MTCGGLRAVTPLLLFTFATTAGCVRQVRVPTREIPRLRPLMAGAPPSPAPVVVRDETNVEVEVEADTEIVLAIRHRGRQMQGILTPAQLTWRGDGLLVMGTFVSSADIDWMELNRPSPGRTLGLVLGSVGTALFVLLIVLAVESAPPGV